MKKILPFLLTAFFFGCNSTPETDDVNTVDSAQQDCFTPDDAIIKFHNLNEKTFGKLVVDFLTNKGVELKSDDSEAINKWSINTVFGLLNSSLEWQLWDEEFCEIEESILIEGITGQELFKSRIMICNSYLNEDSAVGGYWTLVTEDFQINIKVCNQIKEEVGLVPYYEVLKEKKGGYKRSLQSDMMKYYVNTSLIIEYGKLRGPKLIRDTLVQDAAILYSGLIMSLEKEVQKNKSTYKKTDKLTL